MLYVDGGNTAARHLYERLGFATHRTRLRVRWHTERMTETLLDASAAANDPLPRWSVADVYESLHAPDFAAAMERSSAEATRLAAMFDEHDVRAVEPRPVTAEDGEAADAVIAALNRTMAEMEILEVAVYATVSTDSPRRTCGPRC